MLRVKNVDKYEKNRVTIIIPVFNEKNYIDKIIKKIKKFGKSYDQLTKETVKTFLVDSKKSKFKI